MDKERILIIDDDPLIRAMLSDGLQNKGYAITAVESGKEALEKLQQYSYDLIISDLILPDLGGHELLKKIKEIVTDATIIVITAYPSFESVQEALRVGAYDYVTKPFDKEQLFFTIQKAVNAHKLMSANKVLTAHLEKRTKELSFLYKIGKELSYSLKVDNVLQIVLDRVSKFFDIEICSILMIDKGTNELVIKCAKGLSDDVVKSTRIKIGEAISGWVVSNKKAVLIDDIENNKLFSRRNREKYYTKTLISAPLIVKDEGIGVINVNNKRSRVEFGQDDLNLLEEVAGQASHAIENATLYKDIQDSYLNTVITLLTVIEAKDHYTRKHSEHVSKYAVAIACEMGMPSQNVEELERACILHDIGKIGIHDYILNKQGKLSDEEWKEMQQHSEKSVDILKSLPFLDGVVELVRQHHERFDGKGYPNGKKGDELLLGSRIMTLADSFDAMMTKRPYRKAFALEHIVEELIKNKGTQFDPEVVDVFLRVIEKKPELIKEVMDD